MTGLADPTHDPRPTVETTNAGPQVVGTRCPSCGWSSPLREVACSVCRTDTEPARFGPTGTVWSWTVVRIPVADLTPPYALAFVDLDDGPRVLCHLPHVDGTDPAGIGTRVALTGTTPAGDLAATPTAGG